MSERDHKQQEEWKRIERFLQRHREEMKKQGGVYARSDASTYVIRFRDHTGEGTVHTSFAIGKAPKLVEGTRKTIKKWQEEYVEEQRNLKHEVAETLAGLVDFANLGDKQSQRVKKVIRERVHNGRTVDAFYLAWGVDRIPHSRNGRPPNGARWGTAARETQGRYPGWDSHKGRPFEVVYDEKGNRKIEYGPKPEDNW